MSGAGGIRPEVRFASPRKLPRAGSLRGRVVVLDIAFAADGLGRGFDKTTGKFIEQLGSRLAKWVDHHDHPRHAEFAGDERFVLCTKAEHGACPEMITEEMVRQTGPVDTILAHFDLDGIYSAAKWILGGREPYAGADDDARAVDTRMGAISATATRIDKALRAHYADESLKQQIVNFLLAGADPKVGAEDIDGAVADYERMAQTSVELSSKYVVDEGIALVRVGSSVGPFDKTELLLMGQRRAPVSVVVEKGNASIAASFDSGLDFVELLELGGGMPTRVSVPGKRLDEALTVIRAHLKSRDA
ncbi:MAG: hypothetical protein ACPHRO_05885 [Nannocystaceae bacterium]